MFAGLPLIMTEAHGPGHIAFSKDDPGEMIAVPAGRRGWTCASICSSSPRDTSLRLVQHRVWFRTQNGNDSETHYPVGMFMDRFSSPQANGLLLLHAAGNVFVKELGPQESILIKPKSLIFKDPTVQMQLHFRRSVSWTAWGSWGNRYM